MATNPEEYYEGPVPGKGRRWALLGFILVIVILLGFFVRSTLPTQRPEFIGRWKGAAKPGLYYDLRADGTYSSVVLEDWVGGNQTVRVEASGKWRASADALYLTTAKMTTPNKLKDKGGFKRAVEERLAHEIKIPIHWTSPTQWESVWTSYGKYVKEP